jgi:hypothetical protein
MLVWELLSLVAVVVNMGGLQCAATGWDAYVGCVVWCVSGPGYSLCPDARVQPVFST